MEEKIIKTEYSEVMEKSYIDYAMSVIIARALPDVRDGLKPVQRRTLYDMYELGIKWDKPFRKSARIVGDTMGKYHPHGDSSIYDSLVVMSQDFKKGMPLVEGHGNFGSIEGDGAAAMRYTEARLSKFTQENFLSDLDKDVVDFISNFDETEREPSVLPVKVPNLLINGAEGIAVGMATSIPPHNMGEVIDALKAYMKNPDITTKELMRHIKGPDFPTGGIVCNKDDLLEIYETGMGKIKVRGTVDVEKLKGGKTNIVITEIPYTMIGAGISRFLMDVANLSETKKTTDIIDISNQSSKDGIRFVIELKKDADTEKFIQLLYKKTRLEDTFGVNMLAVSNQKPETLSLKGVLEACTKFQFEITTRKYQNLLQKELERKEIQEGLIKACNVIDLIIEILRGSKDRNMAKACLIHGDTTGVKFKYKESKIMAQGLLFSEKQANAILDMRLYKLIGLEIEALLADHDQTMANIYEYQDILARHDSMALVIINELDQIKKEFAKPRKTVITNAQIIEYEEAKPEEIDLVFIMDRFGYVKSIDVSTYERNKEAVIAENKYILQCKNTERIFLFTNNGNLHSIKMSDTPYGKFRDKGVPIDNISNFSSFEEQIVFITTQKELSKNNLVFATRLAMIKVVNGAEFDVAKRTVLGAKLLEDDELCFVSYIGENTQVVMQTKDGYFARFLLSEVPEKKKAAIGVRAMKLSAKDYVEGYKLSMNNGLDSTIQYQGKEIDYGRIKLGKRDTKGTKLRL